jgi:hypothetical protein
MGISEIRCADEGFIGLMVNVSDGDVHWGMWVRKKADSSGNLNLLSLVWNAENKEHPVRKVEI